jgi:hypothetical protein
MAERDWDRVAYGDVVRFGALGEVSALNAGVCVAQSPGVHAAVGVVAVGAGLAFEFQGEVAGGEAPTHHGLAALPRDLGLLDE